METDAQDSDQTTVCVQHAATREELLCVTVTDAYRDHYHSAEYHDGVLYVIRRIGETQASGWSWTDELWAYSADDREGSKLYATRGLDFRTAPGNRHIAVPDRDLDALVLLDRTGRVMQTVPAEELSIQNPKMRDPRSPTLTLEAWSEDGGTFWVSRLSGPSPQSFFVIDAGSPVVTGYDISDLAIPYEYDLNPNTGNLVHSDCPVFFEVDGAEAFAESDQAVTLSTYDLEEASGWRIATSVARCFNPRWVDDHTVEYDDPEGEGRVTTAVAKEAAEAEALRSYLADGVPADVAAWDAHALPNVDVTLPVPPGWVIMESDEMGDVAYSVSFRPPLWDSPATCGYQCPELSAVVYRDGVSSTLPARDALRDWLDRRSTPKSFGSEGQDDAIRFFGVEAIEETTLGGLPALAFYHEAMGIQIDHVLTVVDGTVIGLGRSHVGQFELGSILEVIRKHTVVGETREDAMNSVPRAPSATLVLRLQSRDHEGQALSEYRRI